jgi:hypothetical protein
VAHGVDGVEQQAGEAHAQQALWVSKRRGESGLAGKARLPTASAASPRGILIRNSQCQDARCRIRPATPGPSALPVPATRARSDGPAQLPGRIDEADERGIDRQDAGRTQPLQHPRQAQLQHVAGRARQRGQREEEQAAQVDAPVADHFQRRQRQEAHGHGDLVTVDDQMASALLALRSAAAPAAPGWRWSHRGPPCSGPARRSQWPAGAGAVAGRRGLGRGGGTVVTDMMLLGVPESEE